MSKVSKENKQETVSSYQEELLLEGLTCTNCAGKIEREVKALDGVDASFNLMNQTLTVKTKSAEHYQQILEKITDIVHSHEPDVGVTPKRKGNDAIPEKDDHEILYKVIRFSIGVILLALTYLLSMEEIYKIVLFTISYLIIGGDILYKAIRNLFRRSFLDETFLMTIATIGAFAIGEYLEGIAVMLFYQIGELFQSISVDRSRKSIAKLMDIRPDTAHVKKGDLFITMSPEQVDVSDIILVKPGEKIPLDGIIIDGSSFLDTSALTGETMLREVNIDSEVLSGTINQNGVLTIRVTKTFENSTVSKILELVENASSKKAKTENFITKFARYYTPIVVFTAMFIALVPPLVLQDWANFSEWLYRALIFLVISCPCALVISVPLGFFGGIGGASKRGILVKGGNYLEALAHLETVVFDKTGTLTLGQLKVTRVIATGRVSEAKLLEIAAYGEHYSNHPIAKAILAEYQKDHTMDESRVKEVEERAGYGVVVHMDDQIAYIGNSKLMDEMKVSYPKNQNANTIVHVALGQQYLGYIEVADKIKEDAYTVAQNLKGVGAKRVVMLSGDNKVVAKTVSEQLKLDDWYAELLPQDKVAKLEAEAEKLKKGTLAFVGDGINDAPSLARADIGIAMGGLGSDAAMEAADVVIMNDTPSSLVTAVKIAKKTRRIVMENIIFALGIKAIFLIAAAFGYTTMWEAVFADVGVSLIAILNSMRALRVNRL